MSKITDFCIAECERQNDLTTEAVAGMVEAYCFVNDLVANKPEKNLDKYLLMELGTIIKPQNNNSFRSTPVTFFNGSHGIKHTLINRAIENLLNAMFELSPEQFYVEFERIHPFEDGNGRVGAILYNMLNNTMDEPIPAPDFFSE